MVQLTRVLTHCAVLTLNAEEYDPKVYFELPQKKKEL